jgi:hypothetical protein
VSEQFREMFGMDPFRPRDEWDADVHPESLRGQALTAMDVTAATVALIYASVARLPWYRRWPARALLAFVWAKVRIAGWLRS